MRVLIFALVVAGCDSETNFSNKSDDEVSVEGVAEMAYNPEYMVFTDLNWEQGVSFGQDFNISNVGDNNLTITTLDIANSGDGAFFVQEEDNLILGPGLERTFTVVATLYEDRVAVGELRVKSNDADARDLRIPLCAFPAGYKGDTTCVTDEDTSEDTGE